MFLVKPCHEKSGFVHCLTYFKTLPIILLCSCLLSYISLRFKLISYPEISYQIEKRDITVENIYNSSADSFVKSDIKNTLKPVKILLMAFPR